MWRISMGQWRGSSENIKPGTQQFLSAAINVSNLNSKCVAENTENKQKSMSVTVRKAN